MPLVGPYLLVSLVRVLWSCEGLLGLLVFGHGDRICGVLGGEMGRKMRENRVLGSVEWCGGDAAHCGAVLPGARTGSICGPLEVARGYRCCGEVKIGC